MNKENFLKNCREELKRKGIHTKKNEIKIISEAFIDTLKNALEEGEKKINFNGFGNFKVVKLKERMGCNPNTKEKMLIPAKNVLRISFSREIKEIFNKKINK